MPWAPPTHLSQWLALAAGLLLVTWLGHVGAKWVRDEIRRDVDDELDPKDRQKADRRAGVLGHVERGFFGLATVASPQVALGGMVAWAGLKLGANWGSREGENVEVKRIAALAASLTSLAFAFGGGLLLRYGIPGL